MRDIRLVVLLIGGLAAGAQAAGRVADPAGAAPDTRQAAGKAIALLQRSVTTWESKRSCASCHHQHLPIAVLRSARGHGVPFDEAAIRPSVTRLTAPAANLDFAVQAVMQIDPTLDSGSWLNSLTDIGLKPTLATQVFARRILSRQMSDGHWTTIDVRPPQSFSRVTATAVSVRALGHLPPTLGAERAAAVGRARAWLEKVVPADTEDRTFQLLGLAWAGAAAADVEPHVRSLLAAQRPDGGWSQIPRLESDAYATGQALVALLRAGGVSPSHEAVRRGLSFLLSRQQPDGSWLVKTRLHEQDLVSPPYFETGFPHGVDQISSAMGTAWAAMALLESLPRQAPGAAVAGDAAVDTSAERPWMRTALFGTPDALSRELDAGLDPNSRTPAGTTVLMMAAHDAAKVRLLLARGADPSALSETRHNALMVAANHPGSLEAMRLLLDRGAVPGEPPAAGATIKRFSPMLYAIWSGEPEKVALLLDRGAPLPRRVSLLGGEFSVMPLELAVFQRDVPMIRLLAARGAPVNELGESGIPPLTQAVLTNDAAVVGTLLELGADVNLVDQNGETALMHAALVDFGDTAVLDALLAAGARRDVASPEKLTARDLARRHGHDAHARRLE